MRLTKLLKNIEYESAEQGASESADIVSITHMSREVKSDWVYICLRGKENGHNYVSDALKNGASAVIAERAFADDYLRALVKEHGAALIIVEDVRKTYALIAAAFYGNPQRRLKTIGIVGTNGKTTTAQLVYRMLNECGLPCGVIGTLGSRLPDGTALNTPLTTPDPMDLYKALGAMADGGARYAVIELSAHAIALKKAAAIDFYALGFTNLSRDHLDYFSSMDEYESVKHSAFIDGGAINIINADDESGRRLLTKLIGKRNLTYSVTARKSGVNEISTDFYRLKTDYAAVYDAPDKVELIAPERLSIINPMCGGFNAYNLLLSIAVCGSAGIAIPRAVDALKSFKRVDGRFELYECCGIKIIIDFAHTPDGISNVLSAAGEMVSGMVIAVFGAGGDRDKGKRAEMGRAADKHADIIILTADNPRGESVDSITAMIAEGIENKAKIIAIPDRYRAIKEALDMAASGDVIVIAGKGHEDYIEANGVKTHYSDIESVKSLIEDMER